SAASTQPTITQPNMTGSGPIVSPAATTTSTSGGSIAIDPSTTAPPLQSGFTEPVQKMVRFCNNFMFDYTFIPRGNEGLGLNELKVSSRFMLPCSILPPSKENQESNFFFIAPAFSVDFWSNPKHPHDYYFGMPKSTFDANLAFGLNPQFNKDFSMEAWLQLGIASSFKKINKHALYLRGLATGTLSITEDGSFKATGGIKYLDRNRYKLLPVAGVIWTPNEKNVWRLVFPDPKLSHHLGKNNETDWWAYVCGDIGGGRWLIDAGDTFNIDYNDYRFGGGLTFVRSNSFTGHFEVGGAFGRELYAYGTKLYKPKTSVYLKVGLGF
ncbi:MAG: hypothetical protein Q4G59_08870, partial [Planctomycetia bacterium]|nr:hypothetical protein [Planctomycetia bacterium]